MNAYTKIDTSKRRPRPADIQIGANLRRLRQAAGRTQEQLAEALGVTFQQVQKYERGTNRMSAGAAFEVCGFLDVPLTAIFDGCAGVAHGTMQPDPLVTLPRLGRLLPLAGNLPQSHQKIIADLIEAGQPRKYCGPGKGA